MITVNPYANVRRPFLAALPIWSRPARVGPVHVSPAQTLLDRARATRASARGVSIFFRSLATLVGGGMPLARALFLLGNGGDDKRMATVAQALALTVSQGYPLSRAMRQYPRTFSRFQTRMVAVGEDTGILDTMLLRIAEYEENLRACTMKVRSALTYPLLVLLLSSLLMIFGTPLLLEGQLKMIRESGVPVPWITRIVMDLAAAARSPLALSAVGLMLVGLVQLLRRPNVYRSLQIRALRVPYLGRVLRLLAVARFARALEVQLSAGVNILVAIPAAADTGEHPLLADCAPLIVKAIRNGRTLAASLRVSGFFPRDFVECVRVGEYLGRLSELLGWLAGMYERELELAVAAFAQTLEPLVMLVMGGIVTLLMLATMLPMVSLLQTL